MQIATSEYNLIKILKMAAQNEWDNIEILSGPIFSRIDNPAPWSIRLGNNDQSFRLKRLPSEIGLIKSLKKLTINARDLFELPQEISQLTNLISLDLSGNSLTSLPAEIGEIKNLIEFRLPGNRISQLPQSFSRLKKLKILGLGDNKFETVPQCIFKIEGLTELYLASNEITELPSDISNLTNLKILTLNENRITKLPPEIRYLTNLTVLDISDNQLVSIPAEIGELIHLESLNAGFIGLKDFPLAITSLINLKYLRISGNKINRIPAKIRKLINLQTLRIKACELTTIPPEIGELRKLQKLFLEYNHLIDLPKEIANLENLKELRLEGEQLGIPPEITNNTNPRIVLQYFFGKQNKVKRKLFEAKFLVIGQGSVGKTSLVKRILLGTFDPNLTKTEGISINQWTLDNGLSSIKLNMWDFGGQEIMHATHQFFLTKRSLYLLVLDARLTQEENRAEYWLKIIQSFGGESPVVIVGNKADQHPLDIDRTGLQKKYSNIVAILETSAATGVGIEALKAEIMKQVNTLPHIRDLLPETWFTVKSKLEELAKNKNFFTQDEYLGLCDTNDVKDETSQRTLIGFLHDLGIVLHFQDDRRLAELGILNPQWVTNGVYKILNDKALFKNKGVLTLPLLDKILNTPEYPQNKRLFIVEMMRKFELCYDIDRDNFLIPDLLPKDEPENIKFNGIAAFEYQYPVLPSSVITRFIVRMNKNIYKNISWRTGVILKIGENTALVKADIEDRRISISIDGLEHTRRDALSAIRYQLDEIHESIKRLNPQKRVPIPEAPNAEPLDYEYLLQLENEGFEEHPVKDGSRLVKVDVRKLLSGIESESQRKESAASITNIYVGGDINDSNLIAGNKNEANINSTKAKKKRK